MYILKSVTKNQYHSGYHTSWEGKTFWYRSSYELDYAKQLDSIKVHYEVEKLRILYWSSVKNKQCIMIPDFYLPETNTIVEVKSDFTYTKQDWKDRLAVLIPMGYNCKLLLEHKWYDTNNIPEEKQGIKIVNLD